MTSPARSQPKPWQRTRWAQVVAILLGVAPIYATTIASHLTKDQPYTLKGVFLWPTVAGGISIIVICLLLRYLCGERIRDLNLKRGKWWRDVLAGVALAVVTLGLHILSQDPLDRLLPREPMSGLGDLFGGLAQNLWVFALFTGPVLLVGVGFEELVRVFLLTRMWKISPANSWRWFGVVLSAALFGLGHLYQGPAGVVSTAINGLILAVYYLIFGRVLPMVLSHYLHNAIQFVMIVALIRSGVIQF